MSSGNFKQAPVSLSHPVGRDVAADAYKLTVLYPEAAQADISAFVSQFLAR